MAENKINKFSDIPWLEIPAGIFILVMVFGALWWAVYTSFIQ